LKPLIQDATDTVLIFLEIREAQEKRVKEGKGLTATNQTTEEKTPSQSNRLCST
jgi:hypothetical protein